MHLQVVKALADELHCELYAVDARGEGALVTFARAHRLDLVVELLLCGYDPMRELPAPTRPLPPPPTAIHPGLPICRAVWELDVDLLRALLVFEAALVGLPDDVNLKHVCLQTPTNAPYSTSASASCIRKIWERLFRSNYRCRRHRLQVLLLGILDAFRVPNCACPECAPFAIEQGACRELTYESTLAEFLLDRRVSDSTRRTTFCRLLLEQEENRKLVDVDEEPERAPRTGEERLAWLEDLLVQTDAALHSKPPPQPLPDPKSGINMLTLDGGGVKGLVPIHMLLNMQKLFTRYSPDDLMSKFNFLSGTSTGTIIACGLLKGLLAMSSLCPY